MLLKVAIFGCRDGQYLYEQIKQAANAPYEAVCFSDNAEKYADFSVDDIPFVAAKELTTKYKNGEINAVIVTVRKGYSRFCIVRQLQKGGIDNIILLRPSVLTYRLPITFDNASPLFEKQWLNLTEKHKPIIHHLEINIADGCNLNCRGCLHFSNLYEKDEFPDGDELLESIAEIDKHCEIFQFRVLGGEPLLNPNLAPFLEKLRKVLPHADLAVISNGILIPKTDDSLFRVMRENYIGFNLTLYPPTLKMKEKIYGKLLEQKVAFGSHEARTDKFEKFMLSEPREQELPAARIPRVHEVCEPRGVLVVKGRCLYRCPVEAFIGRYYEKFSIPRTAPRGIDVYTERTDDEWQGLIDDLYTKPRPLCSYCSAESEFFEWSVGKPQKEDWLVSAK